MSPSTDPGAAARSATDATPGFQGNDRLLFGIILGVVTFWLFAQTTLNVAPDMQRDLGIESNTMNNAVAITALLCGTGPALLAIGITAVASFRLFVVPRPELMLGRGEWIGDLEPRAVERAHPEDVVSHPRERVPVADGDTQVLFEGLTGDDLLLVVPAKRERVVGLGTFVTDWLDALEKRLTHGESGSFPERRDSVERKGR